MACTAIGSGVVWRPLRSAIEPGTQGADDAAVLTQQIKRLGHQLSDAGFAVGASDPNQIQVTAGLTIKAPGDVEQLRRQATTGISGAEIGSTSAPSTSYATAAAPQRSASAMC